MRAVAEYPRWDQHYDRWLFYFGPHNEGNDENGYLRHAASIRRTCRLAGPEDPYFASLADGTARRFRTLAQAKSWVEGLVN